MNDSINVGDKFTANDSSCVLTVERVTRIGVQGTLTKEDGSIAEGYATFSQLEADFTKVN
jgi:hypothetical protein